MSFWLHGCCGELKGGPVNQINHTSWVAVVTPTDRPKSVLNRCLIELFCGVVCVVTLPFWHFCWCRGLCHRTGSDLLLFVILWLKSVGSAKCVMHSTFPFRTTLVLNLRTCFVSTRRFMFSVIKEQSLKAIGKNNFNKNMKSIKCNYLLALCFKLILYYSVSTILLTERLANLLVSLIDT